MEPMMTAPLLGQIEGSGQKLRVSEALLREVVGAHLCAVVLLAIPGTWITPSRMRDLDLRLRGVAVKVVDADVDVANWASAIAAAPWQRPERGFKVFVVEPNGARTLVGIPSDGSATDLEARLTPHVICFVEPLDDELLFFGEEKGRALYQLIANATE